MIRAMLAAMAASRTAEYVALYRALETGQRVVTNSASCSRLSDYEGSEGVPGNSPRIRHETYALAA
jgi:hypothetical protein